MTVAPLVMGIVNVTPDSFSGGGRYPGHDAALAHVRRLIAEGADILDIGGESTRPGAEPVDEAEEIARTVPLIAAIRSESALPISIDTMKPAVARAAVAAGATMWNDVSGLAFAPDSVAVAADLGCEVVLMHGLQPGGFAHLSPMEGDRVAEVVADLAARAEQAIACGVQRDRILLDPGIGFGKTAEQGLCLTAALDRIAALGFPVLYGASRKRLIAAVDPSASDAGDRLGGSLALALAAAARGAAVIRVHDVRETVQALAVQAALRQPTL